MVGYELRYEEAEQQEFCNLFITKYPNTPVTQFTVIKIEKNFFRNWIRETFCKCWLPTTNDNVKLKGLLSEAENPPIIFWQIAAEKRHF